MGAFVPLAPHLHQLSRPRQAKQYTRLQHCSAADCCAAAALCGGRPSLSHYILTMLSVVLAHCDWSACQLSAATAAPLFQRLQQLLDTSLAPLAAHALTVAMERADREAAAAHTQTHSQSTAHQLAAALLQPATQPPNRYEPNPSRLPTLRDSLQPVLVVRVIDDARRESGVLRVTDSQQAQLPQRPSAPPQEECDQQWGLPEEERKVQFVADVDKHSGATQPAAHSRQQRQQRQSHEVVEDDAGSESDDGSGDEAALSLSLPPHFHQLLPQPPTAARLPAEAPLTTCHVAGAGPQHAIALPAKPAPSASSASQVALVRPNLTASVRRARGSSLHVDVQLSIPCLPTLNSGDGSAEPQNNSGSARGPVAAPKAHTPTGGESSQSQAGQSAEPIVHIVKSRPRPPNRQRSALSGERRPSGGGVLSELPLNTQPQQHSADGATAAASVTAAAVTTAAAATANTETSSGASTAKPRRSLLMSAMMEQRDRRRKEDSRRKEDEMAALQQCQAQLRSTAAVRSAPPSDFQLDTHTASTATIRSSLQRTLDGGGRSLQPAAAPASSGSGDVSSSLRADKRKRDAEGQRLRERRVGLRDRMKEAGVAAAHPPTTRTPPRRTSRGLAQSPHTDSAGGVGGSSGQRTPDAQRQSVLPCTFHIQPEDDAADVRPPQAATLSLEDIMAGRVNYQ